MPPLPALDGVRHSVTRIALPLPSATQNLKELPIFRVRTSGTALVNAEILDTGKYHCSAESLQHLIRHHGGKHADHAITWESETWWTAHAPECARHVAILDLPLAGRYHIEALKLWAHWESRLYEDACMLPEAQRLLFRTVLHAAHPSGTDLGSSMFVWYRRRAGPPSAVQTRVQHRWPLYYDPREAWCQKTVSLDRYLRGADSCGLAKPSFQTKNETLLAQLFPPLASESTDHFADYSMGVLGNKGSHATPAPELHTSDAWRNSKEVLCMHGVSHSRFYCDLIPGCDYAMDQYLHAGVREQ